MIKFDTRVLYQAHTKSKYLTCCLQEVKFQQVAAVVFQFLKKSH